MADEMERRIERLEAILRGPTGGVREEVEMRAGVYGTFKRHKTEGAPKPDLGDKEREHWDNLQTYYEAACRVAGGQSGDGG